MHGPMLIIYVQKLMIHFHVKSKMKIAVSIWSNYYYDFFQYNNYYDCYLLLSIFLFIAESIKKLQVFWKYTMGMTKVFLYKQKQSAALKCSNLGNLSLFLSHCVCVLVVCNNVVVNAKKIPWCYFCYSQ